MTSITSKTRDKGELYIELFLLLSVNVSHDILLMFGMGKEEASGVI
jgi:hypothetical protein